MSFVRAKTFLCRTSFNIYHLCQYSGEASTASGSNSSKSPAAHPPASDSSYKVPEYYKHNEYSYYDIDASMSKKRVPQPSKYGNKKDK